VKIISACGFKSFPLVYDHGSKGRMVLETCAVGLGNRQLKKNAAGYGCNIRLCTTGTAIKQINYQLINFLIRSIHSVRNRRVEVRYQQLITCPRVGTRVSHFNIYLREGVKDSQNKFYIS
jgi:hypothetical protein